MSLKTKKKLFFIFHGRLPDEKAASLFAVKSCEAFASKGIETILLVPRRVGSVKENPYKHYRIKNNFRIVYLPVIDVFSYPIIKGIAFYFSFLTFTFSCVIYLFFKASLKDIIYSNETLPILVATYFFNNTVYELHNFPENKKYLYDSIFKRVKHLLITNKWKADELKKQPRFNTEKIILERNAVDLNEFNITSSQKEARTKLKLPGEIQIVLYTGHLYTWKGVDTLMRTAVFLGNNIHIYAVGGTDSYIEAYKKEYDNVKNIHIVGHRNHSDIPYWQKAADVLVLPNTAKENISKYYTSPMKLFEYMASGRPIIASDIPSISEILDSSNAVLVQADDEKALSVEIKRVLNNPTLAGNLASKAKKNIWEYTWRKRAGRILKIIRQ